MTTQDGGPAGEGGAMREAPERIWVLRPTRLLPHGGRVEVWPFQPEWSAESQDLDIYIRADLARLPEDLVERLRLTARMLAPTEGIVVLFEDILAWQEQQGEKE